jgi:formylglycine-generating enzyme required for sulfatase activity
LGIVPLAEAVAATLAPVLPYLVKAGGKAAEAAAGEVGKAAGGGVSAKLKELWERLRPEVEARPAADEAATDVAGAPEDEGGRVAWGRQVRKILEANPALAQELVPLLENAGVRITEVNLQGSGAAAVGDHSVAAGEGGYAAGRDQTIHHHHYGAEPAGAENDQTSRAAYLRRVIRQTEMLPLQGIDPAAAGEPTPSLKLHAVYTALLTRSPRAERGLSRSPEVPEEGPVSALELLDREDRLVLLGDPGSGKSTFVNFVALCLAGEALGLAEANLPLLASPLPDEDGEATGERQPWSHGGLLPVRVVLRDFAAKDLPAEPTEKATAKCLWSYLERETREAGNADFFPQLRADLRDGRGLVLLDGLDEVPEADHRREQIRQAVQDFSTTVGTSRVVVTSRTYAYQNQAWRLPGFAEGILAPFSAGQIARFVGLWYEQQEALGRMSKEKALERGELLRRVIFGSDRLLALAERPLLLTLMASLHAWRGGNLPEKREQLYADAVELLLHTWESQRERSPALNEPSLAEWLRVDRQEVRQVLEELAFAAHGAQPDLQGTADVAEGDLVSGLMHLSRNPDANPKELVAYLRDRSGLLVERGPKVYTFPHRTFQEYLAACHLTGATFPEELADLGRKAPGRWREVVLLAGAKAARGAGSTVWSLADALCYLDPADPRWSPEDLWGALLAGQVVEESADLLRVGKANEAKRARLQKWLIEAMRSEGLPAVERATAGKALAAVGDPRFDEARWHLPREASLGFVEVPEGVFRMGSDKEKDPNAWDEELQQHEVVLSRYWIGRYPVTVGQYRAFVEASGVEVVDRRSVEGPANHPVVAVSWEEALAYCRWLGERLREEALKRRGEEGWLWAGLASGSLRASLPSEAEWEKAARGTDGRIYPWGNEADPNRANVEATGIGERSSVSAFASGVSAYGCEEMSGNVWEWTRSLWGEEWKRPRLSYPYSWEDERESARILRVVRGGAFGSSSRMVRCANRYRYHPGVRNNYMGFRVVLSPQL